MTPSLSARSLLVVSECSKVRFEGLNSALGLAVGLRVEGSGEGRFNITELKEVLPKV